MLYIATTKTICSAGPMTEGDRFLVFYRENDMVKMSDLAQMAASGVFPSVCEPVADRDDMLVLLGIYLGQTKEPVTILDPAIPAPRRYSGRIVSAKPKTVKKKLKKMAEPRLPEPETGAADTGRLSEPEPEILTEESGREAEESDAALDAEKEAPGTAGNTIQQPALPDQTPQGATPVFESRQAEQLYRILHLKSSDAGLHWPPTGMLMENILKDLKNAKTDAEFETAICARRNGSRIWDRIQDHLDEIRVLKQGEEIPVSH